MQVDPPPAPPVSGSVPALPHMQAFAMVAMPPHSVGQAALRHADAAEVTVPWAPQMVGCAQVVSVLPASVHETQQRQLVSV